MKEKKTLCNCDPRLRWLMDRALRYFQLKDESLAVNMLERHNGRARNQLHRLFTASDNTPTIFYIYQTTYTKTFYKEVTLRKEVPRPNDSTPHTSDRERESDDSGEDDKKKKKEPKKKKRAAKKKPSKTESGDDGGGDDSDKDDKKEEAAEDEQKPSIEVNDSETPVQETEEKTAAVPSEHMESDSKDEADTKKPKKVKKEKLSKSKKRPRSPASVVETLPTESTDKPKESATMTIKMKRIIRKEKKLSQLHTKFGPLSWNKTKTDEEYVFFLLRSSEGVPIFQSYTDAKNEMSKYFYIGQIKLSTMDDFLQHTQMYPEYVRKLFAFPFDDVQPQTEGLEKFLNYRGQEKKYCPSIEAYRTADSIELRLNALRRSLELEGGCSLEVNRSYICNPKERLADLTRTVKFPHIVNIDETNSTIEDRPDLIELVTKLKRTIRHRIKTCPDGIPIGKCPPIKKSLIDSLNELGNMLESSMNSRSTPNNFDLSLLPELAQLNKEKIKALTSNKSYVQYLERTAQTWAKYVDSVVKKFRGALPEGKGPLPLYEYWSLRHELLSPFIEECNHPIVCNMLSVLRSVNSPSATDYKLARNRLRNYYDLCSDNVEYLKSTLTELKTLSKSKQLKEISAVVPDTVDGLRVMWVLSTYWGTEVNFVELLARIRWVICHKVTQILNVPKLFKMGNDLARTICQEAIGLMDTWKNSYTNTRNVIENTRCEQRWEFERDLLFQDTEYISHVARNLLDIINVVKNYEDLFCRQFKNTVRDSTKIDSIVHKVKDLTMPLITADFNVFDREYAENWKILVECFWTDMKNLEKDAIRVIKQSFANLRSTVEATELLHDLRMVITSEKLDKLLLSQFDAISARFSQEVKTVMDNFIENRDEPPLLRHHEQYSGSVYWSRSLYCSVRGILLTLQEDPNVLKSQRYKEALEDYTSFVDMIAYYEKSVFSQMLHKFMPVVPKVFEKNIIKVIKEKAPRTDEAMDEYWDFILKRKVQTMKLETSPRNKEDKKRKIKKVTKPIRKTIEKELRGKSASSESLSDSSCSSARSSSYSSADESEVLSLVSKEGTADGELTIMEEDDESPVDLQDQRKQRRIKPETRCKRTYRHDDEQMGVKSQQAAVNSFSLGAGVYKSLAEILNDQACGKEMSKLGPLWQKNDLLHYHDYYISTSGESSEPEVDDLEETNGEEGDLTGCTHGQHRTKSTRATSHDVQSSCWSSSGESNENQSNRPKRNYSKAYLKSLIKMVKSKQIALPEKPKKLKTISKTSRNSGGKFAVQEPRKLDRSIGYKQNENQSRQQNQNTREMSRSGTAGSLIPKAKPNATEDSSSVSENDSCDSDSSYSNQNFKRKMLMQHYNKEKVASGNASSIQDAIDDESTSGSDEGYSEQTGKPSTTGGLTFHQGDEENKCTQVAQCPEVTIVVASDIYNENVRNVSRLALMSADELLHPSKLHHPSSFSLSRIAQTKAQLSEKQDRKKRNIRSLKRRIKASTFWSNQEADSSSSDTSRSLAPATKERTSRLTLFAKYQDEYKKKRIHGEIPSKMTEVEDWPEGYTKAQIKTRNAQQDKFAGPLCPMKSLRALISVRKQLREKLQNIRRGLPKIYSGCRHDIKRFSWNEFMGTDVLIEHGYSIQINYSQMYECAISEIELFEELGYEIPNDLRHISVIKDSLHSDLNNVVKMIRKYSTVLKSLQPMQIAALKPYISNVEKIMYFGMTQYTWSSLNIAEFCDTVMVESNTLEFLAFQLRHMESNIESIVMSIIDIDCFQCPTNDVYSFSVFFKFCDFRSKEASARVKKLYMKLTQVLYRMESVLFSEMTGNSEYLLLYYMWAENTLFNGLITYVVRNLSRYEEFLLGLPKLKFSVEALFANDSVSLIPDLAQIAFKLSSQAENIIGTLSALVRWQEGTCHFVPQLKTFKSGSIHRFSFVEDLVQCSEVKAGLDHIYETVSVVVEHIDRYVDKWSKFSHLWTFDAEITMRKFLRQQPSLAEYDECFSFYHNTIEHLKTGKRAASVFCVRIVVHPITAKVLDIAQKWKTIIGDQLVMSSRALAANMKEHTQELFQRLTITITSLETFQSVLLAVNNCSAYQVEAELNLKEIHERHHLLNMWKLKIAEHDRQIASDVENAWHRIKRIAAYRTHLLGPTLKLFVTKANEVCDLFLKTSVVFVKKYTNEGPGTFLNDLSKGSSILEIYKIEFAEMDAKRQKMVQAEKLFDLQPTNFSVFCQAYEMFKNEVLVYDLYNRLQEDKEIWSSVLWSNFNPKKLLSGINYYLQAFGELSDSCKSMPIASAIEKHMLDFRRSIPLMLELQNEALRQRHWEELMTKTGRVFEMDAFRTKMKHLFSMMLHEHYSLVAEIIANAEREAAIEAKLCSMSGRWIDEELPIVRYYKASGGDDVFYSLGEIDDLVDSMETLIDELIVMSQSKFSGPFKVQIDDWLLKVSETLEVLILWKTVQKVWTNLDSVYAAGSKANNNLPGFDTYKTVDVAYAEIIRKAKSKPNVFLQCLHQNKRTVLRNMREELENCTRQLHQFFDLQRTLCPRFYLLNEEELLNLMGRNEIPSHAFVTKMFVGVKSLLGAHQRRHNGKECSDLHSSEQEQAVGMISLEDEVLLFTNFVNARDPIHLFMMNVLKEMRLSLQSATNKAVLDCRNSKHNRKEWASQHLGCTVLTSNQVLFCCMVEKAFIQIGQGSQRAMRKLLSKLNKELEEDMRVIRGDLKNNERKKLTTLLIDDAHSRDIIERFVTINVLNAEEFEWSSQLRFYFSSDSTSLAIKQCEGTFDYGFEYMGLVSRQVITPLTERVRLTITQALTMRQGTAILGPTATGKKETIKDLAAVLGVMCLLINCGTMFTLSNLNNWLRTVYTCAVWTCLDKFDRLDISTQSAFSTTLFSIHQALFTRAEFFYCEGHRVSLSSTTNVFITMNPGYKGRHPLPESINTLFRPVVCMYPDTELICTITLISEGFMQAKLLARKMNCLYKLAQAQLSEMNHYDFGLRVVKAVLCVAGSLKRKTASLSENVLLKKALRDVFAPKLLKDDAVYFHGLLEDLFPDKEIFEVGDAKLEAAISSTLSAADLVKIPSQIHKVAQLLTTTEMWRSVIVLGPTSGGKSVIIETFIQSQASFGQPLKKFHLNPNTCSMAELFGHYAEGIAKWRDGVLTRFLKESKLRSENVVIVLDGSMDSEWVENMSSIMDDNRTLTLANGDLIRMEERFLLIFEMGHLDDCSPATVSRNGLIYVNPADLGYSFYWQHWICSRMDDFDKKVLGKLFEQFLPQCFDMFDTGELESEVPLSTVNMVTHLCLVIEAQQPIIEPPYRNDVEEPLKRSLTRKQELTCVFIQALYLSIGAVVTEKCRIPFDGKIKELSGMSLVNEQPDSAISCCNLPCRLPTLFDYKFEVNDKQWVPWSSQVSPYEYDSSLSPYQIIVPNEELSKMRWTLGLLYKHNCYDIEYSKFEYREKVRPKVKKPVLLIGESGSAKTSIVRQYLNVVHDDNWEHSIVNMTPLSGSEKLQQFIESKLTRTMRNNYAPKGNKNLLIFIDDLDTAVKNQTKAKPITEFLRFIIERQALMFRGEDANETVIRVHRVGAMGKPANPTRAIDPRFLSLFAIYRMNTTTLCLMKRVFSAVLAGHTSPFSQEIKGIIEPMIDTTLLLFQDAQKTFLPSPVKFHYLYSIRDLTHIFHGLLMTRPNLYTDQCHFLRVWRNEITRVFCDRLMNEQDQKSMHKRIDDAVLKNFPNCHQYVMRNPLLFGDFRNAMVKSEPRQYEDLLDYDAVYHLFTEIMLSYNRENEVMDLVLFEDALEHVTRIHRVLRQPRGHVMLLGAPNAGKRSLTKMASYTAECRVSSLTIRRYHNYHIFREKTSTLVKEVGRGVKRATFLVACEHPLPREHLEILNEIITNYSETYLTNDPTLAVDEDATTLSDKKESTVKFSENCLDNFHVVLCVSPVHEIFKNNCTVYSGIIRSSYINWIFPWAKKALSSIATTLLKDVETLPETNKQRIIESVVHIHHTSSQYVDNYFETKGIRCYLGPTHFLKFISDFLRAVDENQRKMSLKSHQLARGLGKLDESNVLLKALNEKLTAKKKLISEQLAAMEQLVESISEAEELLNAKREESKGTSLQTTTVRKMMCEQEAQIEDLMNKANPLLYSGRRALSELDQDTVSSMCASLVVPEPVQVVSECVAILRGAANLEWTTVREYMEDPFILTKLREMDYTAVSEETQQLIKTRLRSSRRIGEIEQISAGGHGLLKYLENVLHFCQIYKEVRPMQKRSKEMEKQWHKLNNDVEDLNEAISALEEKVSKMKIKLSEGGSEQDKMKDETQQMDKELQVANSLFANLNEDSIRWKRDLRKMKYEIENVHGDCIISAAFLNYASVFDQEMRRKIIYCDWKSTLTSNLLRVTDYYTVENHLAADSSISRWLAEGLPKENHAVQNVILMKQSQKYPIIVDPDQQMMKWILAHEKENGIVKLSTNDANFDKNMITALQEGKPAILCEFEYLSELLLCLIQRNITDSDDSSTNIIVGDKPVPFNPNFRLYIVISNFQKTLDPSVFTSATVIDCTIDQATEERSSQLAMLCSDPALAKEYDELLIHRCQLADRLSYHREITLQYIFEYENNIFDDFPFIERLTQIHEEIKLISSRMNQEAEHFDEIEARRKSYLSIAQRSAVMFRSFNDLERINPFNRTSYETFSLVFKRILLTVNTEPDSIKLKRLTKELFDYQCAGLKNENKLVYGFYLAVMLEIQERRLTAARFVAFVGQIIVPHASSSLSPYSWITEEQWNKIEALSSSYPTLFQPLKDDIRANAEGWEKWTQNSSEHAWMLPGRISDSLDSSFDKLFIIKTLKIDALHSCIQKFVREVLGDEFLTPTILRFEDILLYATEQTPIIVSVGTGSDPLPKLLAQRKNDPDSNSYILVSFGKGTEQRVLKTLINAMEQGRWLVIQNCHVAPSFMYQFYQVFTDYEPKNPNFRLWMTTEDESNLSLQVLLSSHKIVMEELTPLKINLLDTYHSLDPEQFSSCAHPAFRSAVFALAFFHGVIEERKKFGKYGWNMMYDFKKTDLLVSITILKQYLDTIFHKGNLKIPWDSLKYFIGEVVYGGRVTDDDDRRILNTYINEYFGDFILQSASPFMFNCNGKICQYPLPPFGEKQDYIDYIQSLPLLTEPSVFGIHEKRQLDVERETAEELCRKLAINKTSQGNNESTLLNSQSQEILTIICEIETKIPDPFQCDKLKSAIGPDPRPTALCLIRELETINRLIFTMKTSLIILREAVTGISVITDEVHEIMKSLLSHSTPRMWLKFIPNCHNSLGKWQKTLEKRFKQLEKWVSRGEPWILWLSGLAYPRAYLTAIEQVACRDEGWQIDSVAIKTEVTDYQLRSAIPSKPKTGLYVEGLFLDGAQWDPNQKCLAPIAGYNSVCPLPIVGLFTTPARGMHSQGCLKLCMYSTKKRKWKRNDKVVAELNIPTKKHESYWILENVYIVMNAE